MPGHRDPRHLEAMSHRRPFAALVRRLAGNHEPDTVERTALAALLGQDQMPQMDRVKCASENSQSHQREIPRRLSERRASPTVLHGPCQQRRMSSKGERMCLA